MKNAKKAEVLDRAALILNSAASAYRHGRTSTAQEKTAVALSIIADVTDAEGWHLDEEPL